MKKLLQLQYWYGDTVARRHARRLQQPTYPFAGSVPVLRRLTERLGNANFAQAYCNRLPGNVFCHVGELSVDWWILTPNMLWLAQVDRESLSVAFAGCVDFQVGLPENKRKMREQVHALSTARPFEMNWSERLDGLAAVTDEWMRRNKPGTCLPGLFVLGKKSTVPAHERLHSAMRLQEPRRLEVAVPLILHALWTELRNENCKRSGPTEEAWQMASVLVDNPWESWQTVRSGRLQ